MRPTPYRHQRTAEHLIRSHYVPEAFRLKVFLPVSRVDGSERFPVLYVTDSDDLFDGLAALAHVLQSHGETPRFIMVGIGYEDAHAAAVLRMRDFFTHGIRAHFQSELNKLLDSPLVSDIHDRESINRTDAHDFLQFVREELMPFITAHYPTLAGDNSYSGYSAGGGFGLYALFAKPDTFKRYILGSPTTSYNGHHFGIELAQAFIKSGQPMRAKVFMSVGELEEFKRGFGQLDLVSGYCLLGKFLKSAEIPGLDLTMRVFPGETHATAWTLAFAHGLKTLFGPVDRVPFWPEF